MTYDEEEEVADATPIDDFFDFFSVAWELVSQNVARS
jgi:hypothetical protein